MSVVDTRTGTLHRVPVEAVALHRRSGCYPALCAIEVPAASLTTPAVDDCLDCAAQTAAAPDRQPRRPLLRWSRSLRPGHRRASR